MLFLNDYTITFNYNIPVKKKTALVYCTIYEGRTSVCLLEDPFSRKIPLLGNTYFLFLFAYEERFSDEKMLEGFEIAMEVWF